MRLGLYQNMGLYQTQSNRPGPPPFADIPSDIDEGDLLDRGLERIESFTGNLTVKGERANGNYFSTHAFGQAVRDSSNNGQGDGFKLLNPKAEVIMAEAVSVQRDPQKRKSVLDKLSKFKRDEVTKKPRGEMDVFSRVFLHAYDLLCKDQDRLIRAAVEYQRKYLETGNPFDLKPLTQEDLGSLVGLDHTVVSRRFKDLTIKLPDGYTIFARDLVPGQILERRKGLFALRELMDDSTLYDGMDWKVSDDKLVPILDQRFGLSLARRTVTKYRNLLSNETSKPLATRRQIREILDELKKDPAIYGESEGTWNISEVELRAKVKEKYSFLI